MRNLFLRNSILGLGMVSASGISAAPILIEAEDPIETEQTSIANLDAKHSEASGKAGISMDNANRGSYAVYAFDAPEEGTYDLSVWYITMNTRWISLQVNDQTAYLLECDKLSGGWNGEAGDVIIDDKSGETEHRDGVVSKTIQVYCVKGRNYLTVKAIYGYSKEEGRDQKFAPTIDRFELEKATAEISCPRDWDIETDRITRQCDNYDAVTGGVSTDDRPAFSNKRGTNISQSGGTVSYNVSVPEEGVYLMELWYATMQRRWISVKVNKQVPTYVSFADFSEGWGDNESQWVSRRQVPLYLNKGANVITFGQYTKDSGNDMSEHGDSPSLDYFTLDLVTLPGMEEPEKEIAMYKSSLDAIAEWSGTIDTDPLRDHNEYTLSTSSATEATVTLSFPVGIYMSGYAVSTDNDPSQWYVETSSDGNVWAEADVTGDSRNGNILLRNTSAANDPSKFIRLTIKGSEPVSIGDFAVFGNLGEKMDGAIIPDGFTDFETTHMGFDVADWHEGIDKLFDGNPFTQFTVTDGEDGGMGDNDDIKITIFLADEVTAGSYTLSTHRTEAAYLDRAPKTWTLEAFDYNADNGAGSFTTVDSRDAMAFAVPASTLIMDIAEPVKTDCYVLTLKNRRGRATHLSGFQLYPAKDEAGSGIGETIAADTVAVYGTTGKITISAGAGKAYAVYNTAGMSVSRGVCGEGITSIDVPSGLYIVTVDGHNAKILVR